MSDVNCVAIDLETATHERNSACALGISTVSKGVIVETTEWRFCPPNRRFNATNTRIHGISRESAKNLPLLPSIWQNIQQNLSDRPLVAHFAQFDINVLRQSLAANGIECPTVSYTCSWLVAKRTWPSFGRFGLANVARRLGLPIDHHNPSADARLCASILLAACREWGAGSLEELERKTLIRRGTASSRCHHAPGYTSAKCRGDRLTNYGSS